MIRIKNVFHVSDHLEQVGGLFFFGIINYFDFDNLQQAIKRLESKKNVEAGKLPILARRKIQCLY